MIQNIFEILKPNRKNPINCEDQGNYISAALLHRVLFLVLHLLLMRLKWNISVIAFQYGYLNSLEQVMTLDSRDIFCLKTPQLTFQLKRK